jgi:chemotaxis protein histidine kinase CheA
MVVKNLMEANGGNIEVESQLGKVATFTVIPPYSEKVASDEI